jgi:hypothetical protein
MQDTMAGLRQDDMRLVPHGTRRSEAFKFNKRNNDRLEENL